MVPLNNAQETGEISTRKEEAGKKKIHVPNAKGREIS